VDVDNVYAITFNTFGMHTPHLLDSNGLEGRKTFLATSVTATIQT